MILYIIYKRCQFCLPYWNEENSYPMCTLLTTSTDTGILKCFLETIQAVCIHSRIIWCLTSCKHTLTAIISASASLHSYIHRCHRNQRNLFKLTFRYVQKLIQITNLNRTAPTWCMYYRTEWQRFKNQLRRQKSATVYKHLTFQYT